MKKIVFFLITVIFIVSGCAQTEKEEQTMENKKVLYLVSKVSEYRQNKEDKSWKKMVEISYEYENAYPVSMLRQEMENGSNSKCEFSYTFENDIPIAMIRKDLNSNGETNIEYKDGKIYNSEYYSEDKKDHKVKLYQYANEDEYFTVVLHSSYNYIPEEQGGSDCGEEVDEVTITKRENGLLEKTVNHGMYSNWIEGEDRIWYRFNGTYTMEYDEDGIAHKPSVVFRAGPPNQDTVYEVTKENDLVKEVVAKRKSDEGNWVEERKLEFTYSDIEIDAIRYSLMINAHVVGDANTYYIYNWY